jgi:hypothetical protein
MKPALASLSLLLFFCSCAAPSGRVKADLSKVRPWSEQLARTEPMPTPYVVDFEAGSRALTYLAVDHSNEIASPSLRLVDKAMDSRPFKAVVLEGFPRSMGLSPATLRARAESDGANGFYRDGEASLAVRKAVIKSIPFVGGEPDDELVNQTLISAGFSLDDLYFFYIVRLIPQWRKDGTITRQGFEGAFVEMAPTLGPRLGIAKGYEPSLEYFHKWYQLKMGKPFRVRDVNYETVAPYPAGELITQRIAAITGRLRNEHIVRVTEEMLNSYGKVLVVYGATHFLMQQLALESMLGKPTRIADQP